MKYLVKNKYWEIDKEYNLDKLLYLLIDRPDYISGRNEYCWKNNKKQFHRNYDLPNCVTPNSSLTWKRNGDFYRENNKPVVLYENGNFIYRKNGSLTKIIYNKNTI